MWVQWTRDAIREAQLNPDVSRQWEEASTIFAGTFGEASATVEDLARFDAAIARLARLRIDIDEETLQRLHELAVRERRSTDAQSAVLLRLPSGCRSRPLHTWIKGSN